MKSMVILIEPTENPLELRLSMRDPVTGELWGQAVISSSDTLMHQVAAGIISMGHRVTSGGVFVPNPNPHPKPAAQGSPCAAGVEGCGAGSLPESPEQAWELALGRGYRGRVAPCPN